MSYADVRCRKFTSCWSRLHSHFTSNWTAASHLCRSVVRQRELALHETMYGTWHAEQGCTCTCYCMRKHVHTLLPILHENSPLQHSAQHLPRFKSPFKQDAVRVGCSEVDGLGVEGSTCTLDVLQDQMEDCVLAQSHATLQQLLQQCNVVLTLHAERLQSCSKNTKLQQVVLSALLTQLACLLLYGPKKTATQQNKRHRSLLNE